MTPGDTLETLWKNVLDHWDGDTAHALFMQHCQQNELLGEAAARYAGMRGDHVRGAAAQKRLEAVALLAQMSMVATRREARRTLPRWFVIAVALLFGGLAAYAVVRAALL
jgi:hypothetical protein